MRINLYRYDGTVDNFDLKSKAARRGSANLPSDTLYACVAKW